MSTATVQLASSDVVITRERFDARVAKVLELCAEAGWDAYGQSPAIPRAAVAKPVNVAQQLVAASLPWPYVYPTHEGGLSFEWTFEGRWEVTIEFEPAGVFGDASDVKTNVSYDFELPASADEAETVAAALAMFRSMERSP